MKVNYRVDVDNYIIETVKKSTDEQTVITGMLP